MMTMLKRKKAIGSEGPTSGTLTRDGDKRNFRTQASLSGDARAAWPKGTDDHRARIAMEIIAELQGIAARLEEAGIDYALCGGLAMAVYAMPRATLDIDLMIQVESLDEAGRVIEPLGFKMDSAPMDFHGGAVKMSRFTKIDPRSNEVLILDFLLVTEKTVAAWDSRRDFEWEGGKLRVVSPQGLILLKELRRSGTDQDDIDYLRSISDED